MPLRLLSRAAERFFRHVDVDDAWREAVEQARLRGPVIYVLRNVSVLDYLALDHLTRRLDLPRVGFVNERPDAVAPQRALGGQHADELLRQTVASGHSAALFLKRPPQRAALGPPGRGRSGGEGLLEALLSLQESNDAREIMMVPQTFVWTQRPEKRGFSMVDALLGPADFPGELRQAGQFLLNYKNGILRAGESLSLREFLAQQEDAESRAAVVHRLTYALLRKVERERRTIVGPAHKAPDRMREEVLRSPRLQKIIRELAGPDGETHAVLTEKARAMLRDMQTIPDLETQRSLELLAEQVLDRVYSGIDVDEEGIARLRDLRVEGSVVLLPSHKSHVDYIVLSYVLRQRNIQIPVIAAGDNLSFFPAGPLLRRAGAFFIRRSFRADRLYTAVVDAYLRRLLRDGWMVEFFLEGGRSRTGKPLAPMLGLLNMIVASALGLEPRPVFFLPVAIGYERLMEEGAFAREVSGEQKQREDASQLLALGGLLNDRWGRVNIQFGEPIELGELRRDLGGDGSELRPAKRRAIVKKLAHQVMREINRVTAVTPGSVVALVLLSHSGRGVDYRDLLAHCRRLTNLLLDMGARATPSLVRDGVMRESGITEVLKLYLKSGLLEQHVTGDTLTAEAKKRARLYTGSDVFFTVADNKRLRLDITKNHIVHWLVDRALIAVALLCRPEDDTGTPLRGAPSSLRTPRYALRIDGLSGRVQSLSRLFKYEFMYRADAAFDAIFADALSDMVARGELTRHGDVISPGEGHSGLDGMGWLTFFATIVRNFIEGYRVAARSLALLTKGPMAPKDLLTRALRVGERMYLEGAIERSEAVSKPLVDNALSSFLDQGYLIRDRDKLALGESFRSEIGAAAIEARVAAFLRRRADDEPW